VLGAKFWFSSTEKNLLAVQEQCLQNKPFANCCSPFVVASAQQELRSFPIFAPVLLYRDGLRNSAAIVTIFWLGDAWDG